MFEPQTLQVIIAFAATVTALCAVLAGIGLILNMVIAPLKQKQALFESELKEVKQNQGRLEKGQARLEGKLDKLYELFLKINDKK